MILFENDYQEGCVSEILDALKESNFERSEGYGCDSHCENAARIIKKMCGVADVDVHFLVGGTQANLLCVSLCLKSWEGVISAASGHINVHETGAVEATGHKVIAIDKEDGKLTASDIEKCVLSHNADGAREHTVKPKMVYISFPTETGLIYSLSELDAIYSVCRANDLYLFIDGARLGYGLTAENCDVSLADIAALSDLFYIGGTKCGALFGEAAVIVNAELKKDFRYAMKQRGAMLAKGRILGIQFETLFTNNEYFDICKRADKLAMKIKDALSVKGIKLSYDGTTNQLFPVFENRQLKELEKKYKFGSIRQVGSGKTEVRICTSWATEEQDVSDLIKSIIELI